MKCTRFLLLLPLVTAGCNDDEGTPQPDSAGRGERAAHRGLINSTPEASPGYTLISPIKSKDAYLLDMQGEVVHTWKTHYPFGMAVTLLDDGHLLRGARDTGGSRRFHGGGLGGRLQELDWNGNVVWDFVFPSDELMPHHDLEVLPNGNVLALAWEFHSGEEALAAGRAPEAIGTEGLWPDAVIELRPLPPDGAEIVWMWRAWDHLVQDRDPEAPNYARASERPGRIDVNADHRYRVPLTDEQRAHNEQLEKELRAIGYVGGVDEEEDAPAVSDADLKRADWLHVNTVSYCEELDLIVLSTPRMNEVWVIDHSTTSEQAAGSEGGRHGRGGDLLYRWGNPQMYGMGTAADRRLFFQHQPEWIERGDGTWSLLVYNNGRDRPGNYSSVEELVLPFDAEGGFRRDEGAPFGPSGPIWIHELHGPYFSAVISGAQRLPGGNTFICSGVPGRLLEVTHDGERVWDFISPFLGERDTARMARDIKIPLRALFRATKIPLEDPRLQGKL
jgi:hypothetical protein